MALPLIPIIGAALGSFSIASIKYLLPFIIFSLIKILGITLVTYTGLDLLTGAAESYITSSFSGLGADIVAILTIAGFLDAINISLAVWAAQIQLRQVLGAFSKITLNPSS